MSHSVISTHLHSSPLIVIYLLPFSTTFARLHSCPFMFTPLQPSSCISTHLRSSPLIPIRLHRGLRESTEPGHLSFQLVENVLLTPPLKVNPPGILVLATGPPCCNCDHRPRILGCLLSVKKDLEMAGLGPLRPGSRGCPKRQSSATSSKTLLFH